MTCPNIEDSFQGVDHLDVHSKIKRILRDIDINKLESYVTELSSNSYNNFEEFKNTSKLLQKKYQLNPGNLQINYIYRKLVQEKKISKNLKLQEYLISKISRKSSGIQQISVLMSPEKFSCKWNCAYCPNFKDMPRSYIPNEPACRRATQNDFKADLQFWDRATSYSLSGHPNDKIEGIFLGGTFDDYPEDYIFEFTRDFFYAANTFYEIEKREKLSLEEEQKINETAVCKIIGLTIESRPDYIKQPKYIERYLKLGVTRIQFGIQSIYDEVLKLIKRGCTHQDAIDATKLLRDSGYKSIIHIMPNLPYPDEDGGMYTSMDRDEEMFDYLMDSEDCQADEWKIYPTSIPQVDIGEEVYHHTKIEEWFNAGTYAPYSNEDLIQLAVNLKIKLSRKGQTYRRITRFIRDIPIANIQGGASIPNMRQYVHRELDKLGEVCPCIRCSEIKNRKFDIKDVKTVIKKFRASGGDEYFISKEVNIEDQRYIIGFIRLRISKNAGSNFLPVLYDSALIRELHVYGNLSSTTHQTDFNNSNTQHRGYGKDLLNTAENIAIDNGLKKMSIISGVGVRNYYRKLGYEFDSGYMTKKLHSKKWLIYYNIGILLLAYMINILYKIILKYYI